MRAVFGLTIAATALGSVLAAQIAPQPVNNLVTIDAVVTDARGASVPNLTAEDFTIVEGGVAEEVESATFVAADRSGPATVALVPIASREIEQAEAGRPGARLFAFYLDEYHVSAGPAAERTKELMTRFIEHELGPRDLAVIVKPLDSLLNFRLTHDRNELIAAVSTFEGRQGDYTPKNTFEQNYIAAPVQIEAVRAQIVTSALNALVLDVGSLHAGRKTLLVVSEGFARPLRRREDVLPTVESVARNANRVGVSIYPVDPRALEPPAAPDAGVDTGSEHDALRLLASETDGRVVFTAADAASVMPHIASDSSGYYLLTFRPARPGELRTFHQVDLHVKPPNLSVHARKGYWPASSDDVLRAREERRAALPVPPPQPMRHTSPIIHPWFGVARVPGAANDAPKGMMQVSFVWEAVPPIPGDRVRHGPPALVSIRATNNTDGKLVFEGESRSSSATGDASHEVPNQVAFETAPGRLLVQLEIQDADANVLDTDVRDVIVGGLAGPVELGTPEVLRATNAREFHALTGELEAVPVATRDFVRADHLLIRLPVYSADSPLAVVATVSGKPGQVMHELTIAPVAGTPMYQTDLSLGGLVAGTYAVTITATGPEGNASESVDFTIVP